MSPECPHSPVQVNSVHTGRDEHIKQACFVNSEDCQGGEYYRRKSVTRHCWHWYCGQLPHLFTKIFCRYKVETR